MKKFKFRVIQTDTYIKEVELETASPEEGVKILSDSFQGIDLASEMLADTHESEHFIECLNPVDNKKYYVVWVGRVPGVYGSWDECKAQTNGFKGASFKSFVGKEVADAAYLSGPITIPPPLLPGIPDNEKSGITTNYLIDDNDPPF